MASLHHRVVAFDARGHGRSERAPADVSRAAHIADAAYVVEHLGLAPCVVVGQSLGGVTAILLAAGRPELVGALVVAEAAPIAPDEATIERVERWLAAWPVPFPDCAAAVEFFGGPSLWADAWADGLEQRDDGWWPRFELAQIVRTLRAARGETFWREWEAIHCPTLVVAGKDGSLPADVAAKMLELLPQSRLESIRGRDTTSTSNNLAAGARWSRSSSFRSARRRPRAGGEGCSSDRRSGLTPPRRRIRCRPCRVPRSPLQPCLCPFGARRPCQHRDRGSERTAEHLALPAGTGADDDLASGSRSPTRRSSAPSS